MPHNRFPPARSLLARRPITMDRPCFPPGNPWHLNVPGVTLLPASVVTVVFRDRGTPASPLLAAVTIEQ
jgi:hypothetical protein